MAERSHEWGRLLTGRDDRGIYGIKIVSESRARGAAAELARRVRSWPGEVTAKGPWRPGLVAGWPSWAWSAGEQALRGWRRGR